jgi:hypothetical protein
MGVYLSINIQCKNSVVIQVEGTKDKLGQAGIILFVDLSSDFMTLLYATRFPFCSLSLPPPAEKGSSFSQ